MKKITIEQIGKEQDNFLNSIKKGEELWLTENRLKHILKQLFPKEEIIHNKVWNELGIIIRPDFRIPSLKLVIEFQGYRHFTNIKVVDRDILVETICNELNYKFLEIPYFIQPTTTVLKFLFGNLKTIKNFSNGFPHGFIHPKAELLGSFSLAGLIKVHSIFKQFPIKVKRQCYASLKKRAELLDIPTIVFNPLPKIKNIINNHF